MNACGADVDNPKGTLRALKWRRWRLVLISAGVVAFLALASAFVYRYGLTRTLLFELEVAPPDAICAIQWCREAGRPNGVWLDAPPASDHDVRKYWIEQRLPNYEFHDLTLAVAGHANARLRVINPRVIVRLFNNPFQTQALTPRSRNGVLLTETQPEDYAFHLIEEQARIAFDGRLGRSYSGLLVGTAQLSLLALLVLGFVALLRILARRLPPYSLAFGFILAFILIVRLTMLVWAPVFVTGDSLDYLSGAQQLIQTQSFGHFTVFRPAGYPSLVALAMLAFERVDLGVGLLQAGLGTLTALCVYGSLRHVAPTPWALLGMFLVGADPILLQYEHFLLTETLAACFVSVCCYLFTVQMAALRSSRHWGLWLVITMMISAVFGFGPYVRPNLRVMIVLLPVLLLVAGVLVGRWRRATVLAGAFLLVSGAVAAPSLNPDSSLTFLRWHQVLYGYWSGLLGVAEMNQTGFFPHVQWQELRQRRADETLGPYRLANAVAHAAVLDPNLGAARDAQQAFVAEAVARQADQIPTRWLTNLMCHFGVIVQPNDENRYWSGFLSGAYPPSTTNWLLEPLANTPLKAAMIQRARQAVDGERLSFHGGSFQKWYEAYAGVRPVVGLSFLIGAIVALKRREWVLVGFAGLALLNAGLFAVLMLTDGTRFAVPFYPVVWLLAVYLWSTWLSPRQETLLNPVTDHPIAAQSAG